MSALQQALLVGSGGPASGQAVFTTPGTTTWVCPEGVTSVSVVAVGAGGAYASFVSPYFHNIGGGGGALAYTNNISVVPGQSYTVVVGNTVSQNSGESSSFGQAGTLSPVAGGGGCTTTNAGGPGGTVVTGTGGSGGTGGYWSAGEYSSSGGGGAGGYSGSGGTGASNFGSPVPGSAGAGGGGGGGGQGYRGGGVGIHGEGASGSGSFVHGNGGSGSVDGLYGAGGSSIGAAGHGAVRIIWPGNLRQFPSTRTADE